MLTGKGQGREYWQVDRVAGITTNLSPYALIQRKPWSDVMGAEEW